MCGLDAERFVDGMLYAVRSTSGCGHTRWMASKAEVKDESERGQSK